MLYDEMNTTPLFSRIKSALTANRDSMIMTLQFQQIKSCLRFKALMMMMIMMKLMRMRSMMEDSLCANGKQPFDLEGSLVGARTCFFHPMMMIIIIISLKRITLCKSTIDDDYTQGSSYTIAIRISSFSTKESRLANEKGDHKTPKSNLIKPILFSTIATTAMSNDVALSLSLSLSLSLPTKCVLFCFCFVLFFDRGRLLRDGMHNSRGDIFSFGYLLAHNWLATLFWCSRGLRRIL
jgi:hypothetical protein